MSRTAATWAAALFLACAVAVPRVAHADSQDETSLAHFSWGLGAGLCTLVYTPLKVAYAATAIPIGGLVWLFSVGDAEVSRRVITQATAGDFVVTPEHLKRERTLVFIARREGKQDADAAEARAAGD